MAAVGSGDNHHHCVKLRTTGIFSISAGGKTRDNTKYTSITRPIHIIIAQTEGELVYLARRVRGVGLEPDWLTLSGGNIVDYSSTCESTSEVLQDEGSGVRV